MKQTCLVIVLAFVCLNTTYSQQLEVGVNGGISQYYGDLAHHWIHEQTIHPAGAFWVDWHVADHYSIGARISHTTISGTDVLASDDYLRIRNLSFRSPITELQGVITWYPRPFNPGRYTFYPYFRSGISLFHFNPQANYQGEWVDLQPLGTEGQGTSVFPGRKPYSLTQVGIPVGIGMKWALNQYMFLGVETTMLWTMTDYLDDVSLSYVNPDILIAENGSLAYQLSNRTGEYLMSEPLYLGNGSQRGNTGNLDQVGYFGVTYSVIIPKFNWQLSDSHKQQLNCSF